MYKSSISDTLRPRRPVFILGLLLFGAVLFSAGCSGPDTPIDAGTREAIDSISAAEIRLARIELDSQCLWQHTTVLPRLVDSIKQQRLREIQEQLKTVPK